MHDARCSHPSPDEMFLEVGGNIERSGFHVTMVLPSQAEGPFAYTTGLATTLDHPELVVVGFEPAVSHTAIWALFDHLKEGPRYEPGERIHGLLRNDMPVRLDPVDLAATWMTFGVCHLWYRDSVPLRVWQILLPDPSGLLPGDDGCDPAFVTGQRSVLS